jgi:hypothetical protein
MFGMHFDSEGLSIEELMAKEIEFRKKLATAHNAGANANIISQFEMIIEDVKLAMQEKFMIEKFNKEQTGKKDNFDDSLSIG